MPTRLRLLPLVSCLALLPAGLAAQTLSGSARLQAPESSIVVLNAVVSLPVDSHPTVAGEPVRKGAILAEMKVEKLERELRELQKDLRSIQEEKRYRTSSKEVTLGGGSPLFQGPSSGVEADLAIKEADAMRDMLEVQTRLSQASPRAPEDGYLVRNLVAAGADAKRRKPLVSFVAASRTTLTITVPAVAATLPPGTAVDVASAENAELHFRGVIATGGSPTEVVVRPLELPFLALDRPQTVTVTVAP
jgi:hypothetical protein